MCTALNLLTNDHYFGRNLDIDRSYGEQVVIVPRRMALHFWEQAPVTNHFAMIGMAAVVNRVPLFYDAANEKGLAMAGLNFPGNAYYPPEQDDCDNIPPYELIPWILSSCATVDEALVLLRRINLVNHPFSKEMPLAPLHWIVSDRQKSIVVESMQDKLHIYDAPTQVMTNNPPYPYQQFQLHNYRHLRIDSGDNSFAPHQTLEPYCLGLGALGLPGDNSSMSRFVRAVWASSHSVCDGDENASVSQFFHILSSVEMIRGTCQTDSGTMDVTVYTSCINTDRGRYYYTTYDNRQINCVNLHHADLDAEILFCYPLHTEMNILHVN